MDNNEELEIAGPSGLGVKFKGHSQALLGILLVFTVSAALAFQLYSHEKHSDEVATAQNHRLDAVALELKELQRIAKRHEETQEATIAVIAMDAKERAKLNLRTPDRLREMQRQ